MMWLPLLYTIIFVTEGLLAIKSDIDINRIDLLPQGNSHIDLSRSLGRRVSVSGDDRSFYKTNDYDDHSSGYYRHPKSLRLHVPATHHQKNTEKPLKVHPPREDPRLFYQSDAYLEENGGNHVNHEVTFIYPGREVIRAKDKNELYEPMPLRVKDKILNTIEGSDVGVKHPCIKCPSDRTLIVRKGSSKVLFQAPRLLSCSGHKVPRNVRFIHMYGPKFGSLIEQGSHQIIGKIVHKNRSLQMCKMQVHVMMQSCATPKHLISRCEGQNCSFTCRDPDANLYGPALLMCGSDMTWIGELPVCRARSWCDQPLPPEHGRVICKGASDGTGRKLAQGSTCRLHCSKGWRWLPRVVSVCRAGEWTATLTCQRAHSSHKEKNKRIYS